MPCQLGHLKQMTTRIDRLAAYKQYKAMTASLFPL